MDVASALNMPVVEVAPMLNVKEDVALGSATEFTPKPMVDVGSTLNAPAEVAMIGLVTTQPIEKK